MIVAYPLFFIAAILFRSSPRPIVVRVLCGPLSLRNYKYITAGLKKYGYKATSFVEELYSINARSDFDSYYDSYYLLKGTSVPALLLRRYLSPLFYFPKVLKSCDVIITTFDGGFLRASPFRFGEMSLLKLANKKTIVWPYGNDTYVYSEMRDLGMKNGMIQSYPGIALLEESVKKQVRHFCRKADVVIGNVPHEEPLSKWDALTIACYGVDVENEWKASGNYSSSDGEKSTVKIFHATNHAAIKGTHYLTQACDRLNQRGVRVELVIAQGKTNAEVRELMLSSDIVVEGMVYGYAATAIEAMSLGKPVVANLENTEIYSPLKWDTHFIECPIVSASASSLEKALEDLIRNPERRKSLGVLGRTYVTRYHSVEGNGLFWHRAIEKAYGQISGRQLQDWWKERSVIEGST